MIFMKLLLHYLILLDEDGRDITYFAVFPVKYIISLFLTFYFGCIMKFIWVSIIVGKITPTNMIITDQPFVLYLYLVFMLKLRF